MQRPSSRTFAATAAASTLNEGSRGTVEDLEQRVVDEAAAAVSMITMKAAVGVCSGSVKVPSTKGTLRTLDRNLYIPNVGLQDITALHCTILMTNSKTCAFFKSVHAFAN